MDDTGNNPSLTAAAVVVTGLIGANFAQVVMDKFGLKDPIARGMATAARFVSFTLVLPYTEFRIITDVIGVKLLWT